MTQAQQRYIVPLRLPSKLLTALVLLLLFLHPSKAMTWASTWKDILSGGSPRWKVDDVAAKQQALSYISKHLSETQQQQPETSPENVKILCPLAGDDPFVHQAWKQGYSVTSIDLVPDAVAAMRNQFSTDDQQWNMEEKSNGSTVWNHERGRATLYAGDMMEKRHELLDTFDAVYDKDSFGALDKSMRQPFCQRLADYTKDGAIVYIEVKYKDENNPGRDAGPPFHVEKDDLMEPTSFGESFDFVASLGKVYDLPMPGMDQTAHILRRKPRGSGTE